MAGVTVAVVGSRVEAELLVGRLRSHGIKAHLSADDAGGVDPALQSQGVRILVPDGDGGKARRLLDGKAGANRDLNPVQRWLVRLLGRGGSSGTR